jgi:hypothetical protein
MYIVQLNNMNLNMFLFFNKFSGNRRENSDIHGTGRGGHQLFQARLVNLLGIYILTYTVTNNIYV